MAVHETSANALAWFFHLIVNHPSVLNKARTEAQVALNSDIPTFADLPKLDCGKWCIEETMRLYPPV